MIINIIYNLSWFLSVVSEKQIALMIILLSTSQMSKKEEILEFAHWWSKLSQHSKHLQSFFLLNSTVGCLLIDEAEAFVFTSVSGDSGRYSGYKTSIWDPLSDNTIGCNHRDYVIHIFFTSL